MGYIKEVREFVITNFLFGDGAGLQDETSFLNTGIIDSTGVLELITFLEETYQIKILETETIPDNLDSINKVSQFLEKKLQAPA